MTNSEKVAEFKKVIENIKYILDQELSNGIISEVSTRNLKAYVNRIAQSDLME